MALRSIIYMLWTEAAIKTDYLFKAIWGIVRSFFMRFHSWHGAYLTIRFSMNAISNLVHAETLLFSKHFAQNPVNWNSGTNILPNTLSSIMAILNRLLFNFHTREVKRLLLTTQHNTKVHSHVQLKSWKTAILTGSHSSEDQGTYCW